MLQGNQDQQTAAAESGEGAAESGGQLTEAIREDMLDSVVFNWLPDGLQAPLETLAYYPLLLILVLVGLGYLAGKLLQFLLAQSGARLASRTATEYDDRLIRIARRPALTTPLMLSLLLATAVMPLPQGPRSFTVSLLATVLLVSWLRASLKAAHVFLEIVVRREGRSEVFQPRTIPIFEISLKVLLVTLAGYLLLVIWGVDPTAWLASAGVIGIVVGFAARDTLANLFSGIFIAADAPYKIGDFIVLDTGERGEVTHLGIRSTRILTRDDIEITVPNAIIGNAKIINESGGPWEKHRIRVPVGVAYGSDVDQINTLLMSVAEDHPEILSYPAPRIRLRRFGPSSLDFELMGWIEKPVLRGKVLNDLLTTIYRRFGEEGVTIPFPQTDVHIRDMPDAKSD